MSMDLENLASKMERVFKDIVIEEKICSLTNLKQDLIEKYKILQQFTGRKSGSKMGKISLGFIDELLSIQEGFKELYENFDDKLMIFVIGNGNVGKSTLLNALIGYKVAETNVLPTTWKIDVFVPETNQGLAVVKHRTGEKEQLPIAKVKAIVDREENQTKESKKTYNDHLKKELKGLSTKEEREEMKKYLGEKYLYQSDISEIRWPVKSNWILEKCLLVDTPGLNQDLNHIGQLGNIHDYYHKADGVLWLLDGQTIAAVKAKSLFEELNTALDTVGGVRNNIIGVINRMDLIRENGGQEAVKQVYDDAKKEFGNKFCNMICLSAQEAFTGIDERKADLIKMSGILDLQDAIRALFISKAENVKKSAKLQGYTKLQGMAFRKIEDYEKQIGNYEEIYISKEVKLEDLAKEYMESVNKDINHFFEQYLKQVSERVDIHINALSQGQGLEFIKNTMYRLSDFISSLETILDNQKLQMKNNYTIWSKLSKISEYKYIRNNDLGMNKDINLDFDFNFNSLNSIAFFTPSTEDNLFSILGNILGKGMFLLRRNGIKHQINQAIEQRCDEIKYEVIKVLINNIKEGYESCIEILNDSFKSILFDFNDVGKMRKCVKKLKDNMDKEQANVELKDIIFEGDHKS